MAVELAVKLLFIVSIVQARAQADSARVAGVVGGVAFLSPRLRNRTSYHQTHWRSGSSLKVAIRESGARVRYPNGPYKGRLELFPNDTLRISHLQKSDSNTYWVYLEDEAGKEHTESVHLSVYDAVPKPTVRATVSGDDPERCEVTLECSVGLENVTYEWVPPSRVAPKGSVGSELALSFNPSLETYTCRASNPVSSSSAQLTRRHPCFWEAEPSAATTTTKSSVLVSLGHLLLLFLTLA